MIDIIQQGAPWVLAAALATGALLGHAAWLPWRRGFAARPRDPDSDAVLEALPDGTLILDQRGRVLRMNGRAAHFLGLSPARCIGAEWDAVVPSWLTEGALARTTLPSGATDSYYHRAGEQPACFRLRTAPLVLGRPGAPGRLVTITDITAEGLLIEEQERHRLSGYLHDEVGQTLSACLMHLARVQRDVSDPGTSERLGTLVALLERTLLGVRARMCVVPPRFLQEQGLAAALRRLASQLSSATQVPIEVDAFEELPPLPFVTGLLLLNSVRTALLDMAARSAVRRLGVRIEIDDGEVAVVISPDTWETDATVTEPGGYAAGESCAMGAWGYLVWGGGSVRTMRAVAGELGLRISLPLPGPHTDAE